MKVVMTLPLTSIRPLLAIALCLLAAAPASAVGGAAGSSDWPCPQRKVATLGASDLQWQGIDPATVKGWRQDSDASALVKLIASRRTPMEDAVKAIKGFAEKAPAAERNARLAVVFAGLLETVNEYRTSVIGGIERFNKRQKTRAAEIEDEGAKLADLQKRADKDAVVKVEYEKAVELYEWNTRVFEERRQNLPLACEIPPAIDGRTFDLVREIQGLMN